MRDQNHRGADACFGLYITVKVESKLCKGTKKSGRGRERKIEREREEQVHLRGDSAPLLSFQVMSRAGACGGESESGRREVALWEECECECECVIVIRGGEAGDTCTCFLQWIHRLQIPSWGGVEWTWLDCHDLEYVGGDAWFLGLFPTSYI